MPPFAKNGFGCAMRFWEDKAVIIISRVASRETKFAPFIFRSYGDASIESLKSDTFRVFLGYLIMFAYTVVMLGRPNLVENRELLQDDNNSGLISVLFVMYVRVV